ncbi:hypothetical protein EON83_04270 [bacterium]|nr:MAG: hypothetical protein EON83_04270 [bacterium]
MSRNPRLIKCLVASFVVNGVAVCAVGGSSLLHPVSVSELLHPVPLAVYKPKPVAKKPIRPQQRALPRPASKQVADTSKKDGKSTKSTVPVKVALGAKATPAQKKASAARPLKTASSSKRQNSRSRMATTKAPTRSTARVQAVRVSAKGKKASAETARRQREMASALRAAKAQLAVAQRAQRNAEVRVAEARRAQANAEQRRAELKSARLAMARANQSVAQSSRAFRTVSLRTGSTQQDRQAAELEATFKTIAANTNAELKAKLAEAEAADKAASAAQAQATQALQNASKQALASTAPQKQLLSKLNALAQVGRNTSARSGEGAAAGQEVKAEAREESGEPEKPRPPKKHKAVTKIVLKTIKMWAPKAGQKFSLPTNLEIVLSDDLQVIPGPPLDEDQLAELAQLMAHRNLQQVKMNRNQLKALIETRRQSESRKPKPKPNSSEDKESSDKGRRREAVKEAKEKTDKGPQKPQDQSAKLQGPQTPFQVKQWDLEMSRRWAMRERSEDKSQVQTSPPSNSGGATSPDAKVGNDKTGTTGATNNGATNPQNPATGNGGGNAANTPINGVQDPQTGGSGEGGGKGLAGNGGGEGVAGAGTGTGSGTGNGNGQGVGSGNGTGQGVGTGSGSGNGQGVGNGSGSGSGNGQGVGNGSGSGSGSGNGQGVGNGSGNGEGNGTGNGSGNGEGNGTGDGNGTGEGEGDGTGEGEGGGAGSGEGGGSLSGETAEDGSDMDSDLETRNDGTGVDSVLGDQNITSMELPPDAPIGGHTIPGGLVLPPVPPVGTDNGKSTTLRPVTPSRVQPPEAARRAVPARNPIRSIWGQLFPPRPRQVSPSPRAAAATNVGQSTPPVAATKPQKMEPTPQGQAGQPVKKALPSALTIGSTSSRGTVPFAVAQRAYLPIGSVVDTIDPIQTPANGVLKSKTLEIKRQAVPNAPVATRPGTPPRPLLSQVRPPAPKPQPKAVRGVEAQRAVPAKLARPGQMTLARNSEGIKEGSEQPLPAAPMPGNMNQIGDGSGLKGEYYLGNAFNEFIFSRADANIDFTFSSILPDHSPNPRIPPLADYTARWTGRIAAQHSETYTFYAAVDDGIRVWIDHKLVLDQWGPHSPIQYSSKFTFEAGRQYLFKCEYLATDGGTSLIHLYWESPSQKKVFVPQDSFFYPLATDEVELAKDKAPLR